MNAKLILLSSAAMLLASCAGTPITSSQPAGSEPAGSEPAASQPAESEPVATSEEKPELVEDVRSLANPLKNLATNLSSTKKIGLNLGIEESVVASGHTVASENFGTKDTTYTIDEKFGIGLGLGVDFENALASADISLEAKVDALLPMPEYDAEGKPAGLKDTEMKLDTSANVAAYLEGNNAYFNLTGALDAFDAVLGFMGTLPVELPEGIEQYAMMLGKWSLEIPAESVDLTQLLPTAPSYVGALTEYADVLAQISDDDVAAVNTLLRVTKTGDDYKVAINLPGQMLFPLAQSFIPALADAPAEVFEALDAGFNAELIFSEEVIKSFSLDLEVKLVDWAKIVALMEEEQPLDAFSCEAKFGIDLGFAYGDEVVVKTLTDDEKTEYQPFPMNMGGEEE